MWFDADPEASQDGFPGLIDRARLMAWICLFGFVGFVAVLVLR